MWTFVSGAWGSVFGGGVLPSKTYNTDNAGPARNFPSDLLLDIKHGLKSPEVITRLKNLGSITEVMLTKQNLKHIKVPERRNEWPCTNPLFIELFSKIDRVY